jgi:hypothetical protein
MKFFNLDCHISVIADLNKIFTELGHEVVSWSVSGHNFVFERDPKSVEIVNQNTWMNLNQEMCDKFYERYKDELENYDAFICTYPLTFSLLYEKFNKPIILHIPIRYEVPFHNRKSDWENFNRFLQNGIDNDLIIPVANSEYDKKYFEFFVKRDCKLIPSLCEYTDSDWDPKINKFLYSSRFKIGFNTEHIVDRDSLGRYKWQDLASYKGLIIIPYTSSTMSIFEHYRANIPLFCPSKKFMMELYESYGNQVLSELTWNKIFGMPPGSVIDCDSERDPNKYNDLKIMSEWIDLSDFYNEMWMPHITYFDSFEDLSEKLIKTDLKDINEKMKSSNAKRKVAIYEGWNKILDELNEKLRNR